VRFGDVVIVAEEVDEFAAPDRAREAYFDRDKIGGRLVVRYPRPGDRIRALGAPGSRKLQDVFVDARVPARMRSLVPLVLSGDTIIWVCGLLSGEDARISRETRRIVRLRVEIEGE
jgi:tRNA(Ile)-lysidine synthase